MGLRLLAAALILRLARSAPEPGLRVGIAPDKPGGYPLAPLAPLLRGAGHQVVPLPGLSEDVDADLQRLREARLDVALGQHGPAQAYADFLEHLGVPTVRFVAPGEEPLHPLYERPAGLAFETAQDAAAFGDLVEEGQRLVLPRTEGGGAEAAAFGAFEAALRGLAQECREGPGHQGRAAAGAQPLLGLVMIVKNENETIRETLRQMRGEVDAILIVDTGSTDGTQAAVLEELEGYAGELVEHPFVDFAVTRTWALREYGQRSAYVFMNDADFVVDHLWRLRAACQRLATECAARSVDECAKAMKVWLLKGASGFYSSRVFPTDGLGTPAGWQYFMPVHEYSGRPSISYMNGGGEVREHMKLPQVVMRFLPVLHDKTPRRWRELDLPILTREHERNPADSRIAFYLAQTYDCLDELEAALAMYQRRIDLGGWKEELYESHMRRARIKHDRMPGVADPMGDFGLAHAISPERAEPLLWMAWEHDKRMHRCSGPEAEVCREQHLAAAWHYARLAAARPMPEGDYAFMNVPVYSHQSKEYYAYYNGELLRALGDLVAVGGEAADAALAGAPGGYWREKAAAHFQQLRAERGA